MATLAVVIWWSLIAAFAAVVAAVFVGILWFLIASPLFRLGTIPRLA